MNNIVCFEVSGRYALFTDPFSKTGGDKCSYQIPTYEALAGIARSIYWKPTFLYRVLRVRVMNQIRTESKSVKPLKMNGGNTLAIYNYLKDVRYQVEARIVWNTSPGAARYAKDRIDGKHYTIARRMVEKGGRRDIFLGTRECQGLVVPCEFGEGKGAYDGHGELAFGVMFHSFAYPSETGKDELRTRFWRPVMKDGIVEFIAPEQCDPEMTRFIRKMTPEYVRSSGLEEPSLKAELEEAEHELA